jgi:hypothetical protein
MTYTNLRVINPLGGISAEIGPDHSIYLAPGSDLHARAEAGEWGPVAAYDGPSEAEEAAERAWSALRAERNARLAATDWTQVADAPVDAAAWAAYRAALRDMPEVTTDPAAPVWPAPPE